MTVLFNDPDEFLDELKKDRGKIYRKIVRVAVVGRIQGDFGSFWVIGATQVGNNIIKCEIYMGEFFRHDDAGAEIIRLAAHKKKAELEGKITALHLLFRHGIYQ